MHKNFINIDHMSFFDIKKLIDQITKENNSLRDDNNSLSKSKNNLDTIFANINNTKISDSDFREFCRTFLNDT